MATISTFQNLSWALISYHIIVEYIYYDYVIEKYFWLDGRDRPISELKNTKVYNWINLFKEELILEFNPKERKEGFNYSDIDYKFT